MTLAQGGRAVLQDVTLALRDAEFVGMLGPAAPATKLMRALLGLIPVQAGRGDVLGRRPAPGNPRIGYMLQLRTVIASLRLLGRCSSGCGGRCSWASSSIHKGKASGSFLEKE